MISASSFEPIPARLRSALRSPCCASTLSDADASLVCSACEVRYPLRDGVPILLRDLPPDWDATTQRKQEFGRRSVWRRRLLYPDLTTKGHQRRRLASFLADLPDEGLVIDVGSSFRRLGAQVINLDLLPTSGVDVAGDLHRIPLANDSVDGLICTGVLEHVEDPEGVVAELHRILRPGGRVYVSAPFLQGYHPSPTDFHRFTREGLARLMRPFAVDMLVNTRGSASTVTWILSSFLAELVSFGRPRLYALAKALFGWLLLPLKFLDYALAGNPFDHFITSGFTAIGHKRVSTETPSQ